MTLTTSSRSRSSSTSRSRLLNKGVRALFGHARGSCRVCNAPLRDRRYRYCGAKCRAVAYAVVDLYQWRSVRERVLRRDGYECVRCGAEDDLEADHVTPLARQGAPLDERNLQTLCGSCNREKGTAIADYRDLSPGRTGGLDVEEWLALDPPALPAGVDPGEYPALSRRVVAPERFFPRQAYGSRRFSLDATASRSAEAVADDPPDELAQYVVDAINRQDVAGLRDVVDYASDLLEAREWDREREIEEIFIEVMVSNATSGSSTSSSPARSTLNPSDVVDRLDRHGGHLSERMVDCGRDCGGCPHGPYLYHHFEDYSGDRVRECLGRIA